MTQPNPSSPPLGTTPAINALPEHSAASVRRRRLPPSDVSASVTPVAAIAVPNQTTPAAVRDRRLSMHAKGLHPVPLLTGAKGTDQRGWPEAAKLPPGEVNALYLNTGLLCAGLRVPDIDIDDPELAQKVDDLAEQELGPAPIRSRADSPRRARIYRAAVGEPGKRIAQGPVLGKNAAGKPIQNKVEILGRGQQLHAFGPHPDGATLEWTATPGDIGLADLTVVTEEQIHNFLAKVAVLIDAKAIDAKAPKAVAPSPSNASVSSGADFMLRPDPRADVADVAAGLEVIPNNDATDWGMWNHIGMAAWRATDGSEEGFEAFDKWSARSGRDNPVTTRERWEHYRSSPPTTVGAHTLFYHAAQAVPGWRKPSIAALKGDADGGSADDGDGFVDFADEDETPVRFGVEGLLEPQGVCGVFAAPSQGKTGVKNLLKVSYATGLPFLGREVHTPGIVLSYVLEDRANAKSLLRMACEGMGVDPARLNGRVFFNSRQKGLSLPSDTKQVFADIAKIEQRTGEKVVAVFIDTIREASPSGSMSDQKDITPLLAAFKEIGRDRMVFVCGHVSVENSRLPLEERNPMGSGDFLARLDTVLHLETCIGKDAAEGFGRVWVQKVRNGPARYSIPLKIRRASSGLPVPALDTSGEVRPAIQAQGRKAAASEGGKSKHAPSNPFEEARTVKVAVAVLRKERHKAHRTSAVAEMMLQEEHFDIGAKSLAERIKRLSRNKDCPLHKMFRPGMSTDQTWRFYDHALSGEPFTPVGRSDRAARTEITVAQATPPAEATGPTRAELRDARLAELRQMHPDMDTAGSA